MNHTHLAPVLVTGATGRIGRVVIDRLLDAGVPVRALTHRSEAAATLPTKVKVFTGDLTVPESLDPALTGAGAVFLVWTAPPQTAAAAPAAATWRSSTTRAAPSTFSSGWTPTWP
ncbi:SDR family oxidoreductase, partial [Nonomuraea sp. NPDC004297]